MECPGSVILCKQVKRKPGTIYSATGTVCHKVAEKVLSGEVPYEDIDNSVGLIFSEAGFEVEFTSKLAGYVHLYVDKILEKKKEFGTRPFALFLEKKVKWPGREDYLGGTLDVALLENGESLWVGDGKFGRTWVDINNNYQIMIYLTALIGTLEKELGVRVRVKKITIAVLQPQTDYSEQGWCREKDILWADLMTFVKKVSDATDRIVIKKDTTLVPTPKGCMWCPLKDGAESLKTGEIIVCPAYRDQNIAPGLKAALTVGAPYADGTLPGELIKPKNMAPSQIAAWLKAEGPILAHLKKVKELAAEMVSRGDCSIPDFQLEDQWGNRTWKDTDEAEKVLNVKLGPEAYLAVMKTPAKAEEALKNKYGKEEASVLMQQLTERPHKGCVLKPVKTAGEEVLNMFELLD
jgi:hypothetical protein